MKRFLSTLLCLVFMITAFAHAVSADSADKTCFLPQAAAQPFSDGDYALGYVAAAVPIINDPFLFFDGSYDLTEEMKDIMFVSLSWSETALYADFLVIDDNITPVKTGDLSYLEISDSVELNINRTGDKDNTEFYRADSHGNLMYVYKDVHNYGEQLTEFSVEIEPVSGELLDDNLLSHLSGVHRKIFEGQDKTSTYRIKMTIPMELEQGETLYIYAAMRDIDDDVEVGEVTFFNTENSELDGENFGFFELCDSFENAEEISAVRELMNEFRNSSYSDEEILESIFEYTELAYTYGLGANLLVYENRSEETYIDIKRLETLSSLEMLGDVDSDGKITASDALIVLQTAVGKREASDVISVYGNVDSMDTINAFDALLILQRAVNKISGFLQQADMNFLSFMVLSMMEDYNFSGDIVLEIPDYPSVITKTDIKELNEMAYIRQEISTENEVLSETRSYRIDEKMYIFDDIEKTYIEESVDETEESLDLEAILGDSSEMIQGYDNGEVYSGIKTFVPGSLLGEEFSYFDNIAIEIRVKIAKSSEGVFGGTKMQLIVTPEGEEIDLGFEYLNVKIKPCTDEDLFVMPEGYTKVEQLQ